MLSIARLVVPGKIQRKIGVSPLFPTQEIKVLLTSDIQSDFTSKHFSEIWIADYSGLESYGDIELFGMYPPKLWGYYKRKNSNRKPYG